MNCCPQENMSVNTNKLLSDNTLKEKKNKLKCESREQCCLCLLFTSASVGTSVSAVSSHGASLPSQVPGIIVSTSSAYMCFNQYLDKNNSINEIDAELESREGLNVKYVDNFSNMSVYSLNEDTLQRLHYPVI